MMQDTGCGMKETEDRTIGPVRLKNLIRPQRVNVFNVSGLNFLVQFLEGSSSPFYNDGI